MLRHMDGWDYCNTLQSATDLQTLFRAQGWYGNRLTQMNVGTGRFGFGNCLRIFHPGSSNPQVNNYRALNTRITDGFVLGVAFYLPDRLGSTTRFRLYDGVDDVTVFTISFLPLGIISMVMGGITYRSPTGTIREGTWFFIEVKSEDTGNGFHVKLNGNTLFNNPTGANGLAFDAYNITMEFDAAATGSLWIDDLRIQDLTGSENNDFIGNTRTPAQRPSAPGDVTDLTPFGAATNWQGANNPIMPGTVYNYTNVVGDYDLYQMNPGISARDIFGIQVSGSYAQDNGVQLYGQNVIKTGGAEFYGTPRGVFQLPGYSIQDDLWDLNPDTVDEWTSAELNLLQAGPKLESSD